MYVLVALVLTGMQNTSGPVSMEFLKAPMAYCMSMAKQNWAAGFISIGSLAGVNFGIVGIGNGCNKNLICNE